MRLVKANKYEVIAKGDYEKKVQEKIFKKYKDLPQEVEFVLEAYAQTLDENAEEIKSLKEEKEKLEKKISKLKALLNE